MRTIKRNNKGTSYSSCAETDKIVDSEALLQQFKTALIVP
jgi:hypothetical protein